MSQTRASRPSRRGRTRGATAALVALLIAGAGLEPADAHATLVIGELRFTPDPPVGSDTLVATIDLEDPGLVEVEDAVVFIELRRADQPDAPASENAQPSGEADHVTDRLEETSPGRYEIELPRLPDGSYTLSVRDRTYRQEEAVANVLVTFGEDRIGEVVFVLPPTAIGPASLGTWLLWLIVVPLVAGVVVTILVLRGGKDGDDETASAAG